ncbi:MAG: sporulation protein [Proteobacteria bacterium]|nr:MAG: sporulation protein [Pseudomonadota bacterium]
MADMTMGAGQSGFAKRSSTALTYAGGVLSLAIMAGVAVWGVKLVRRDVSGIPVVYAMEGAMREAPSDPGGDVAANAGLSVNAVAAEGMAAEVPPSVLLAPEEQMIAVDDLTEIQPMAEAEPAPQVAAAQPEPAAQPDAADPLAGNAEMMALVENLIVEEGLTPLTPLAQDDTDRVTVMVNGQPVQTRSAPLVPASAGGVISAPRPPVRPAALRTERQDVADAVAMAVATAAPGIQVVGANDLPAGMRLVQLGAYDSPEVAVREWDRLAARFSDYFGARERVIQKADAGGRTFYRLRVKGFSDLGDARRFCSALQAGRADCIPVVTR